MEVQYEVKIHASEMCDDPESEAEDSSAYENDDEEEDQEEDKNDPEFDRKVDKAAKQGSRVNMFKHENRTPSEETVIK